MDIDETPDDDGTQQCEGERVDESWTHIELEIYVFTLCELLCFFLQPFSRIVEVVPLYGFRDKNETPQYYGVDPPEVESLVQCVDGSGQCEEKCDSYVC